MHPYQYHLPFVYYPNRPHHPWSLNQPPHPPPTHLQQQWLFEIIIVRRSIIIQSRAWYQDIYGVQFRFNTVVFLTIPILLLIIILLILIILPPIIQSLVANSSSGGCQSPWPRPSYYHWSPFYSVYLSVEFINNINIECFCYLHHQHAPLLACYKFWSSLDNI